jgi:2-polyprenyl-3-methyl-5-hydroxy-6-metoxy-1,4-benzoquinol methylase
VDPEFGKAYAELYRTHWWFRAREIVLLREIERILRDPGFPAAPANGRRPRILDVGCGDALFFDRLIEIGDVEGIESEAALVRGDNPHRARIHFGLLDENFRPPEPYDLVLLLDVLEHIKEPAPVLRRALELLAPGGKVIVTVPAFQALWTTHDDLNHHFVRHTKRSFHQLAANTRMTIERERYLFQWTFAPKLAAHVVEAVLKPKPSIPRTPPRIINGLLAAISVGEAVLFENMSVPFGGSLLVVGSRAE